MLLACTTSEAAYEAKYILVYEGAASTSIYCSEAPLYVVSQSSNYYIGTSGGKYIFKIDYQESLKEWITSEIYTDTLSGSQYISRLGTNTRLVSVITCTSAASTAKIRTNCDWNSTEKAFFTSFSTSLNLPSGLTEDDINNMIDDALNETTSSSNTANQIQQSATSAYTSYASGASTLAELQATINSLQDQLNTLNTKSSNTLADKVAITNATLQLQLVQDAANKDEIIEELQTDLKVSSNIQSQITGKINEANQIFQNYSQGTTTQTVAVTQINQHITYLTSLITPETPTADIEAINTAINTINGIRDSVSNHSDLDTKISDEAQASDEEELNYLDELTAETTSTIQDLSPEKEFSEQQKTAGKNILSVIWENDIIKKLIPICACFMVVCVVLGIRYKV